MDSLIKKIGLIIMSANNRFFVILTITACMTHLIINIAAEKYYLLAVLHILFPLLFLGELNAYYTSKKFSLSAFEFLKRNYIVILCILLAIFIGLIGGKKVYIIAQ